MLVTNEDHIPIVEIDDSHASSIMQDFLWFTKVSHFLPWLNSFGQESISELIPALCFSLYTNSPSKPHACLGCVRTHCCEPCWMQGRIGDPSRGWTPNPISPNNHDQQSCRRTTRRTITQIQMAKVNFPWLHFKMKLGSQLNQIQIYKSRGQRLMKDQKAYMVYGYRTQ